MQNYLKNVKIPKISLGIGYFFGYGYENFWVFGFGFGYGYLGFWVFGFGFGFGYGTFLGIWIWVWYWVATQNQTHTQGFFGYIRLNLD